MHFWGEMQDKLVLATLVLKLSIAVSSSPLTAQAAMSIENAAAPEHPRGMPTFPMLQGLSCTNEGFMSIDTDGVYRAYLANGTVTDAARLSAEQIEIFLNACEPYESEAGIQEMRARFADANSSGVPDEQLYDPPYGVKPAEKIAAFAHAVTTEPRGCFADRMRAAQSEQRA